YQQAMAWYQKAIALNFPEAMTRYAALYQFGQTADERPDYANAIFWYEKAIALDDDLALSWRKSMHDCGQGTDANTLSRLLDMMWNDLLNNAPLSEYTISSLRAHPQVLIDKLQKENNTARLRRLIQPGHIIKTLLDRNIGCIDQVMTHIRKLENKRLVSYKRRRDPVLDGEPLEPGLISSGFPLSRE
ncbi:MAG TPA: hypothetical protein VJL60_02230, partial [Gammaproteobacteria bacterium]|nr:hypothetical protein [Gammaproteobacteria bacterium]